MGMLRAYAAHKQSRASGALMRRAAKAERFALDLQRLDDEALLARGRACARAKAADEAEALALAREAVRRETGLILTDEQLACALALADGRIAEASTGSGKTLAAMGAELILAARLGRVHVVTVNEYLAGRDAALAGRVLARLGLTVSVTYHGDGVEAKHESYAADVLYGTASEFGFDYLRDGTASRAGDVVQTGLLAAIVDEADSVLIDEARTPLIISGANPRTSEEVALVADAVRGLVPGHDVELDEAKRTATLTASGEYLVELKLPWRVRSSPYHANLVKQALMAEYLYRRDRDYLVRDGKVEIVDEQTGRVMGGRRWSNGLHAAIEAKEGVEVEPETQTMATITIQNYFRLYEHLSGMTGTAMSEDAEFERVFEMGVVRIPDHNPCVREDLPDLFFADDEARMAAVVDDVAARHEAGQPVLVGTQSVEASDEVAAALAERGIPCTVLNARDDSAEAAIVAAAGKPGRVTVSTNMAGRGTDIRLGGSPEWDAATSAEAAGTSLESVGEAEREGRLSRARAACEAARDKVVAAGGLAVVSVGRNQNRRIDDQLRGRSGRQGDVGCSRFFVSLDDDLLRLFNADARDRAVKSLKELDGAPIESRGVANLVEGAQERLSERDAEQRRAVLDYDDVTAAQERRMRAWRKPFLTPDEGARAWLTECVRRVCKTHAKDMGPVLERCRVVVADGEDPAAALAAHVEAKVAEMRDAAPAVICRIALTAAGNVWAEHLTDEDMLRQETSLAGIGGRDPLVVYKSESARLERLMYEDLDDLIVRLVSTVSVVTGETARPSGARNERARRLAANAGLAHEVAPMAAGSEDVYLNRAQRRAARRRAGKTR